MTVSRRHALRAAVPAVLLLIGLLAVSAPPASFAQGGQGQPPAAPPAQKDPALVWGARFFDDAIRYVARGRSAMPPGACGPAARSP